MEGTVVVEGETVEQNGTEALVLAEPAPLAITSPAALPRISIVIPGLNEADS